MPVCEIPKGNRKQPNSHRLPGALLHLPILLHCNWLFASIRYKSLANTLFDNIFFAKQKVNIEIINGCSILFVFCIEIRDVRMLKCVSGRYWNM